MQFDLTQHMSLPNLSCRKNIIIYGKIFMSNNLKLKKKKKKKKKLEEDLCGSLPYSESYYWFQNP